MSSPEPDLWMKVRMPGPWSRRALKADAERDRDRRAREFLL